MARIASTIIAALTVAASSVEHLTIHSGSSAWTQFGTGIAGIIAILVAEIRKATA